MIVWDLGIVLVRLSKGEARVEEVELLGVILLWGGGKIEESGLVF